MAKSKVDIVVRQKGAKKATKEMHKLGGSVKSTIATFATLGIGIVAITRFVGKATQAYAKQELAEKKLQAALGKTSFALLDQASALQKVTRFGDEQIIEAQALIGSFVKDEEAIKKATKATLDLAAAKGFDLTAAADLVSKTLGSTTNALTRYGIQVEGAVGSTERLDSMTRNIARVFGGQATEQAKTLTGQIDQLSNATGDLMEKIGALIGITAQQTGVFGFLIDMITGLGEAIENQMNTYTNFKNLQDVFNKSQKESIDIIDEIIEEQEILTYTIRDTSTELENYNSLIIDTGRGLKNVEKIGVKTFSTLQLRTKDLSKDWDAIADKFTAPISMAFQRTLAEGTNIFQELGEAFKQMLTQMVAEFMARAAIFGFISLLTGIPFRELMSGEGLMGRARGGSVQGGESYLVGERGAEIFTPSTSGTITPNEQIAGTTINVNIMGNVIGNRRWVRNELIPEIHKAQGVGH